MTTVGESYVISHVEPDSVLSLMRNRAKETSIKFLLYKDGDLKPAREPAISCVTNGNSVHFVVEDYGPNEVHALAEYLFEGLHAERL